MSNVCSSSQAAPQLSRERLWQPATPVIVSPAATSARPSQEAREAWERYVQHQWGPMLKALGTPGKQASSGQGVGQDSPELPASAAEAEPGSSNAGAADGRAEPTQPASSQLASPEENSLWSSLAAAALHEASARAVQHADPDYGEDDNCLDIDIVGDLPSPGGAHNVSSETAGTDLQSKLGNLSMKHPWDEPFSANSMPSQEPLTFTSVGAAPQAQALRARRVVRVVRPTKPTAAAAKAAQAKDAKKKPLFQAQLARGLDVDGEVMLSPPVGSSPEASSSGRNAGHDSQTRTRKKRAAATLMEGTSTFHAPPSEPERSPVGSSPSSAPNPAGQPAAPCLGPKPSQAQPAPEACTPDSDPPTQPSQNRLPHPMDLMSRLQPHACCAPTLWPPPAGLMQPAAVPRYPYTPYPGGAQKRAGAAPMKGMQQPAIPASHTQEARGEQGSKSAGSTAPAEEKPPAAQRPPLLLAAALGRTDIVKSLLASTEHQDSVQPFQDHRYTGTHQALEEAAAAASELAAQATGHANKSAPFLSAPCSQHVPQELMLLHCTALHLAAIYGHAATVQALLASPACSPAACNAMGTTALQAAAREGWVEVVAVLAGHPKCQLNSVDIAGRSALHWAAAYGHEDIVNELWCRSANVQQMDHGGWTDAGHSEVAGSLVIAGTPVTAYSAAGWTAAHLAAMKGHTAVIDKLLIGGYQIDCPSHYPNSGWTAAHVAARQGHLEALKRLIAAGAKVQCKSETGASALQCAAESGSFPVFSHVLRMDVCDAGEADCFGTRLVHSAAQGGCIAIMEDLVKRDHNLTAVNNTSRTCLHYAARGMHVDMARWLLEHGADVNRADKDGETALMTAAGSSSTAEPDLVSVLLAKGADGAAQCKTGCTALHLAVNQGSLKAVEVLMQASSDPGTKCLRGTTALHHAAEANRPDCISSILEHADASLIHATDEMGWTALHYAALHQLPESAALLIQAGANVSEQCTSGLTPLHVACRGQAVLVATLLLAAGIDASLRDARGCTALHYAAQTANWGLFSLLHAQPGCRPESVDPKDASLLQYGVEGGSLDIVELLLAEHKKAGLSADNRPQGGSQSSSHANLAAQLAAACSLTEVDAPSKAKQKHSQPATQSDDREYDPEMGPLLYDNSTHSTGGSPNAQDEPDHSMAAQQKASSYGACTPVHVAALKGFSDLIPSLLGAGFSASALDALKRTPLHYAAMKGFAFFPVQQPGTQAAARPPSAQQPADPSGEQSSPSLEDKDEHSPDDHACAKDFPRPGHSSSSSTSSELSHSSQGTPAAPIPAPAGLGMGTSVPPGQPPPFIPPYGVPGGVLLGSVGMPCAGAPTPYTAAGPAAAQYHGPRATVAYGFTADLLLEAGADADAVDMWGCSALHYAAGTGQVELVERLLDLEVDCSQADRNLWTPLHYAAANGHKVCVRSLLDAGVSAGDVDAWGRTPLHWAAERGWTDTVTLLVPAMALEGRDVGLQDKAGSSAAAVAAYGGHVDCVARVLDSTAIAEERGMSALHLAVQGKMEALMSQLLTLPAAIATVNIGNKDGLTSLHWASIEGSLGMVDRLLAAGADVDALTNDHWTPLHEAALNGHVETVNRLLKAGAQVGLKTSVGLTPLHNAASNGHVAVIKTLIQAGALVNARAGSNATALFIAAQNGHLEAVKHLLDSSAEASVAAGGGATALHAAATAGHLAIVEALVAANADVDIQAANGATALHNAAGGGYKGVVKALLAANADIDVQNTNCNTALHLAAGKGHLAVVNLLLEANADALIRNAKGWAPAQSAAAGGHLDIVLRLVAAGACPRSRPELDVLRMLARKTSYKLSYVEGRLKLAEKERQRALKTKEAVPEDGVSQEELAALNAKADANMAALLQEEAALKDAQEAKKGKKKKGKGKKGEGKGTEDELAAPAAATGTQASDAKPDMESAPRGQARPDAAPSDKPGQQSSTESAVKAQEANEDGTSSGNVKEPSADAPEAIPASSKTSPRHESKNSLPLPQKNHTKNSLGRRAVNGSPASSANARSEWVLVPGQQDPLEQKAEWQAAGGRRTKRATAGKAHDASGAPQPPAPEPPVSLGSHQPRAARPQKGAKASIQPEAKGAAGAKGSDGAGTRFAAAPSTAKSHEDQLGQAPKGRAATGKAARPAPAEGKQRLSPSKPSREPPAAAAGQPGGSRKQSEDSLPQAVPSAPISFADVARPARASQPGAAGPTASANAAASSAPAQRPRPRPAQQAAPVNCPAHDRQPAPPARPSVPVPAPLPWPNTLQTKTPSAPVASMVRRKNVGMGPWQAAPARPMPQDTQAGPASRPSTQPAPPAQPAGREAAAATPAQRVPVAPAQAHAKSDPVKTSPAAPAERLRRAPEAPAGTHARADPVTISPAAPAHAMADPVTISPAVTADRMRKAPGPSRPMHQNGSLPKEPCPASGMFSYLDNGHVDWSFPRQGSYGSLSSAAHIARGHSNAAEGASEKQTYSSMESLASLSAAEAPEAGAASHGPKDSQQGRVPLGVSPLSREGAGVAASKYMNGGSMGYAQHLQGGLPGVPSLLQSIWKTRPPPWEASGQPHFAQLPSKPAQRQPEVQMNPMELQRIQRLAEQYGVTCPITGKLMRDPVMAADGYTYERSAILQHLSRSMLSPVTRAVMPNKHLDDALAMRSRISLLIPDA